MSEQTTVPSGTGSLGLGLARRLLAEPLAVMAVAAVLLGVYLRVLDAGLPLWLDEAWTTVIVTKPNFGELMRQVMLDTNAPIYYVLMYFWSHLFGVSETALRFPAFVFGALAPAIALIPTKAIGREARFVWAISLALWIPGIWYSQEARCYSLALCMATGCTLAYAHLLEKPSLRRAALWALLGSLSMLSHYYAAVLVGCQGLAYLWMHRGRAWRTWPAALLFAPALAWMGWHVPGAFRLASGHAWQSLLTVQDLPTIGNFLLGQIAVTVVLVAIGYGVYVGWNLLNRQTNRNAAGAATISATPSSAAIVAAATAMVGVVIVLAGGMLKPSFVDRYLMAFAPGVHLGVALGIVWLARRRPQVPLAIAVTLMALTAIWAGGVRGPGFKIYNFEAASRHLMAAGTRHLVFLFDNPMVMAADQDQVAAVGGFFFGRAGHPVTVETVQLRPGEDPNARLLRAAAGRPDTGILWAYDVMVGGTAATAYPPRLAELDPAWRCQAFGLPPYTMLACHRGARPER